MLAQRHLRAVALVALMILAPLSGCFGNDSSDGIVDAGEITITPAVLTGGEFQGVTFAAESPMTSISLTCLLMRLLALFKTLPFSNLRRMIVFN